MVLFVLPVLVLFGALGWLAGEAAGKPLLRWLSVPVLALGVGGTAALVAVGKAFGDNANTSILLTTAFDRFTLAAADRLAAGGDEAVEEALRERLGSGLQGTYEAGAAANRLDALTEDLRAEAPAAGG